MCSPPTEFQKMVPPQPPVPAAPKGCEQPGLPTSVRSFCFSLLCLRHSACEQTVPPGVASKSAGLPSHAQSSPRLPTSPIRQSFTATTGVRSGNLILLQMTIRRNLPALIGLHRQDVRAPRILDFLHHIDELRAQRCSGHLGARYLPPSAARIRLRSCRTAGTQSAENKVSDRPSRGLRRHAAGTR